jgi:Holliday junction resolvasome RuvABC endonuclease subunit
VTIENKKYLYAFDLSMKCTGMTIFDLNTYEPVVIDSIQTKDKDTHGVRLYQIEQFVKQYIEKYPPYIIVIERGFSRFNASTQAIYKVHGVINKLFKDYKQIYYPPKEIKKTILNGKATKEQVKKKILEHFPNIDFKNEDESDSFATGLTYLIKECDLESKQM